MAVRAALGRLPVWNLAFGFRLSAFGFRLSALCAPVSRRLAIKATDVGGSAFSARRHGGEPRGSRESEVSHGRGTPPTPVVTVPSALSPCENAMKRAAPAVGEGRGFMRTTDHPDVVESRGAGGCLRGAPRAIGHDALRRLGDSLAVELPALTRAALVRIQVPQPRSLPRLINTFLTCTLLDLKPAPICTSPDIRLSNSDRSCGCTELHAAIATRP